MCSGCFCSQICVDIMQARLWLQTCHKKCSNLLLCSIFCGSVPSSFDFKMWQPLFTVNLFAAKPTEHLQTMSHWHCADVGSWFYCLKLLIAADWTIQVGLQWLFNEVDYIDNMNSQTQKFKCWCVVIVLVNCWIIKSHSIRFMLVCTCSTVWAGGYFFWAQQQNRVSAGPFSAAVWCVHLAGQILLDENSQEAECVVRSLFFSSWSQWWVPLFCIEEQDALPAQTVSRVTSSLKANLSPPEMSPTTAYLVDGVALVGGGAVIFVKGEEEGA